MTKYPFKPFTRRTFLKQGIRLFLAMVMLHPVVTTLEPDVTQAQSTGSPYGSGAYGQGPYGTDTAVPTSNIYLPRIEK